MRVTQNQLYDTLLTGIRNQLDIQARGNAQVSSGKRFQRPAQAALDYKTSLDIRHAQTGVQSSLKAINTASTRLNNSMNALNSMQQLLVRAQTLAVQQSSGQIGASERQVAAVEVTRLRDQLLGFANQQLDGQSLFAGTVVNQNAFTLNMGTGVVSYNGNATDRTVAISSSQTVVSNVRGDKTAFTQAFSAIQALNTALSTNNVTGIQAALGQLNTAGNSMTDTTAEVGGRVQTLDLQRQSFEDMQFNLEKRLNDHEGVDIPATISQLQQASVAMQAAFSQVASLRSLTLVNFLR
ncbi:MAG: flagellin [Zetaproteobacteria bacterium]|nr:MAG: flagellin [Zetaproteobacteria bacterium]